MARQVAYVSQLTMGYAMSNNLNNELVMHKNINRQPITLNIVLLWVCLLVSPAEENDPAIDKDVIYKTTNTGDLLLDVYYPSKQTNEAYPLVIYTHGGGWSAGSKNNATRGHMKMVVEGLTANGICVAAVSYRLCDKEGTITIKDCVTDAKDALRFLVKNKTRYKINSDRIGTFGDSAGGQMAQMLLWTPPALFPGDLDLAAQTYTLIAGVSWYGPCDFEHTELFNYDGRPDFKDRFGPRILPKNYDLKDKLTLYREMSPITYLRKDVPPLLMIQGDKDTTIPVHHATFMQGKAAEIGAPVEIVIVKHAGHNWRSVEKPIEPSVDSIVEKSVTYLVQRLKE